MASNAMSQIGVGTSLQGKFGWLDQAALRATQSPAQVTVKQKEEKPIDWKDFSVNDKDLLPVYAHQSKELATEFMNKGLELKKKGYSNAQVESMMQYEQPKFMERYNQIRSSNTAAIEYRKANPTTNLVGDRAKAEAVFLNPFSTPQEMAALNNPEYGTTVNGYNFAYTPKTYTDPSETVKKYEDGNFDIMNPVRGKPQNVGGKLVQPTAFKWTPAAPAIKQSADEILAGNEGGNLLVFRDRVFPTLPDIYKTNKDTKDAYENFNNPDPKVRIPAQRKLVEAWVHDRMQKPDKIENFEYTPPQPSEGEKKTRLLIGNPQYNVPIQSASYSGGNKTGETVTDFKLQARTEKPVSITNTRVQDSSTGTTAKDLPSTFKFDPSDVVVTNIKKKDSGKIEKEVGIIGKASYYDAADLNKIEASLEKAKLDDAFDEYGRNNPSKDLDKLTAAEEAEVRKLAKPTEEEVMEEANRKGLQVRTRDVIVPYEENKNIYGENVKTIDKHLQDWKGQKKPKVNSNSPSEGEERAVQGGTAIFKGGKWVMKK